MTTSTTTVPISDKATEKIRNALPGETLTILAAAKTVEVTIGEAIQGADGVTLVEYNDGFYFALFIAFLVIIALIYTFVTKAGSPQVDKMSWKGYFKRWGKMSPNLYGLLTSFMALCYSLTIYSTLLAKILAPTLNTSEPFTTALIAVIGFVLSTVVLGILTRQVKID
ncbi:MAG: hypothetical protein ACFFDI_22460 [Promethearchaeota archaeon]